VGASEGRELGVSLGCIEWEGLTDGTDEGIADSVGVLDGTMDIEGLDEGVLLGMPDIEGSEEGASEGSLDGLRETDGVVLGDMDTVGGEVSNTKLADDLAALTAFIAKGIEDTAAMNTNIKPPRNKRFRHKDDWGVCSSGMSFLSKLLFTVESVDELKIALAFSGSNISFPVTLCQTRSNRSLASRSWRLICFNKRFFST
jgi:hypothetical protein